MITGSCVGLYVNDGLSYPKAEYLATVSASEAEPDEAAEADASAVPEEDFDSLAEPGLDDDLEEVEVIRDSFTIPWDLASEVLALTPVPEPTAEGESEEERSSESPADTTPDAAADAES